MAGIAPPDVIVQSPAQHGVCRVLVTRVLLDETGLCRERSRRAEVLVPAEIVVPTPHSAGDVGPATSVVPVVVGEHRVIVPAVIVVGIPRIVTPSRVMVVVVIAEVVVTVPRPQEQVDQQLIQRDDDGGRVPVVPTGIVAVTEVKGGEQHASVWQAVVPIAVHKNGAAGRPDMALGNPDPVFMTDRPVARTPAVVVVVHPASRHPEVIIGRGRDVGSVLQAFRRSGLVVQFSGLSSGPESGGPLVSPFGLRPIPGDPTLAVRSHTPQTADPEEILRLVVPPPVTGNPDDVFAVGHLLGGDFVDRLRRLLGHNDARRRIDVVLLGKRLMNRPAKLHLRGLLGSRGRLLDLCRDELKAGQYGTPHCRENHQRLESLSSCHVPAP